MGLEDFKTDDSNNGNNSSSGSDNKETETTSDDELSGLESFKTGTTSGGSGNSDDEETGVDRIHGLRPHVWSNMTVNERVKHVRCEEYPGYKPEHRTDDSWEFEMNVEISCVCGNNMTFCEKGKCNDCQRRYLRTHKTVVMIPKEQE